MMKYYCLRVFRRIVKHLSAWMFRWRAQCSDTEHVQCDFFSLFFFSWQLTSAIPVRLLTWSEDSVLQMEVSTVVEFLLLFCFVCFLTWKWKQPSIHWWPLCRKKRCYSSDIFAQNAKKFMWRKRSCSATGNNTISFTLSTMWHEIYCLVIFILIWTVFIWR